MLPRHRTSPHCDLPFTYERTFSSYSLTHHFETLTCFYNSHHLLHAVSHVSGGVLWANLHLLFWLSLIPFVTGWMGENHFATLPVAAYGLVLFMCAIAYSLLVRCLISQKGDNHVLADAIGSDRKGKLSLLLYPLGMGAAFIHPWLGFALYIAVALAWLVPDRRIEGRLKA